MYLSLLLFNKCISLYRLLYLKWYKEIFIYNKYKNVMSKEKNKEYDKLKK